MSFLLRNLVNQCKIPSIRKFHSSLRCLKAEDKKGMLASLPAKDMVRILIFLESMLLLNL
jgi:hypothetical protein